MKIGLIGNGFVGNAILENLKKEYSFCVYDKDKDKSNTKDIEEVCQKAKIVFVALPTPMLKSGKCDLSILFGVITEIALRYNDNIIIIKSTIPPGTCERLKEIHPNLRIVFSPEFLTEANSVNDFRNCNRVIFGGEKTDVDECVEVFSSVFPDKVCLTTGLRTAEMVKYFINTFLAVKVSFANEIKEMCDTIDINYNEVKRLALYDKRIGGSHLAVPGPDGSRGFGGTCFPKDLSAMIQHYLEHNLDPIILQATWDKNSNIRENKDWLTKIGRSISEK